MPIKPRPPTIRNYTLRGEQFITVLTLYYLTNFILKDLTEEKEMKLLHLLKNTQTDRMKTHKKRKKEKISIHSYMYYNCIKINFFDYLLYHQC